MEAAEFNPEPIPFPRAYTSRMVDGQLVPVEIARHRSHLDEVDDLMGNSDRSFVEKVRANYYELEGGRHVMRMLSAFAAQGDFTPNASLRNLAGEFEHLRRGYSLRNASSGTCDCPGDRDHHFRGRCCGCGASLAPEFLQYRESAE